MKRIEKLQQQASNHGRNVETLQSRQAFLEQQKEGTCLWSNLLFGFRLTF